jgi:hypothetical protein
MIIYFWDSTPYATPVNWNFKGGAAASATKGTPGNCAIVIYHDLIIK